MVIYSFFQQFLGGNTLAIQVVVTVLIFAFFILILGIFLVYWDRLMNFFEWFLETFAGISKARISDSQIQSCFSKEREFLEIKIPRFEERSTFQVQQKFFRTVHSVIEDSYRAKQFPKYKIFRLIQKWWFITTQKFAPRRLITLQISADHSLCGFGVWVDSEAAQEVKSGMQSAYPECEINLSSESLKIEENKKIISGKVISTFDGRIEGYWWERFKTFKDQESDPIDSFIEAVSELRYGEKVIISHSIIPLENYYNLVGMEKVSIEEKKAVDIKIEDLGDQGLLSAIEEKSRYSLFKYVYTIEIISESKSRNREISDFLKKRINEYDQKDMCHLMIFELSERPSKNFSDEDIRNLTLGFNFRNKILRLRNEKAQSIIGEIEIFWLWHLPQTGFGKQKPLDYIKYRKISPTKDFRANQDGYFINLGESVYRNLKVEIGIKSWSDLTKHVTITGGSGSGKSETIKKFVNSIFLSDEKIGTILIDPKNDLAVDILTLVPEHRKKDVIYINPTSQIENPITLPFFDKEVLNSDNRLQGQIDIMKAISQMDGATSWGPQLEDTLKGLFRTANHLENPTFDGLVTMTSTLPEVKSFIPNFPINITEFWKNLVQAKDDKELTGRMSTPLNKIGKITGFEVIKNIIDTNLSNFSLRDAMMNGKIIIINLGGCEQVAKQIFATYYSIRIMQIIYEQFQKEDRPKLVFIIDEAQNVVNTAPQLFVRMLAEVRAANCSIVLANQYFEQIDEAVRNGIWANCATKIIMRTASPTEALIVSKFLGDGIVDQDLLNLDPGDCYFKGIYDGSPQDTVSIYVKMLDKKSYARSELEKEFIEQSSKMYGVDREQILARREKDAKISNILKSLSGSPVSEEKKSEDSSSNNIQSFKDRLTK